MRFNAPIRYGRRLPIPNHAVNIVGTALMALAGCGLVMGRTVGWAAETSDPIAMSKTLVILKLDSNEPVDIRSTITEAPPTITMTFPREQVMSSLPERSAVAKGLIESIAAHYEPGRGPQPKRYLQSLQIVLSAAYASQVRSEPGRIVVEIHHPASVSGTAVEIGLRGGTIIEGLGQRSVSERFHAMQEALARATPTPWAFQLTQGAGDVVQVAPDITRAGQRPAEILSSRATQAGRPIRAGISGQGFRPFRPVSSRPTAPWSFLWAFAVLIVAIAGAIGIRLFFTRASGPLLGRSSSRGPMGRLSAGVVLIDQLVWRAFERQGYELLADIELSQPLIGTFRVIIKDGAKAALMLIGGGSFFEKQTVQRFIDTMRKANAEQGFLAAAGSFTVPAQRVAKEHRITLIGREQLTELLSVGARSESLLKQLEEQQARLEETKETVRQYAQELDTLRRQRNEASWFLGEERATSAQLEAQVEALNQQLRHHEGEIQRWEQEASTLRKQWEESQWYLGESAARVQHLDRQMSGLQELAKRVESAEHERNEANWYLGEERTRTEALEARLADLQRHLDDSAGRERAMRAALDQLTAELGALRAFGERRTRARMKAPPVDVEIYDGQNEPIFAGVPRDLSSTGVGVESERELPTAPAARLRISLPGQQPIESEAHRMWQRTAEGSPSHYQSGYQLVGVSPDAQALLDQVLKAIKPS